MRIGQPSWAMVPLMLLPQLCAAAVEDKSATPPVSPFAAGLLTETAFGLSVIIALILLLSWLFRRFGKQGLISKGMVNVIGGVSLGPRERAVLLQVGDTRLLVGVAPGQVRMLHVLGEQSTAIAPETGFSGQLRQELGAQG